ncbi:adenosylcobalamin-dependent ribonucleoside-diphosphate reductase [bacterium]|nr:adenosylcobalamin-dependent ribonucleoside-diphosphate reductase [bacterium]
MPISEEIDKMKYRLKDETFDGKIKRISKALCDNDVHQYALEDILGTLRFLPAGRVQNAMGSPRITTAYNCFVSGTIEDSMDSIMLRATQAAETMRRGGGIGYDFSHIRPRGDMIVSLESQSSGPVSFMGIYDSICQTIASSGHRRGAQMGVLRIDHPDVYDFIRAKRNNDKLTGFNISVGITDKFMECLETGEGFDLVFEGKVYDTIDANDLWDEIMESTWDWAEPGVLFIDRIAEMNNLWYCEDIAATNPCGEQPLPPFGACLLGSFNLTKYVIENEHDHNTFDYTQLSTDIKEVVRAMDNVVDRTIYPLKEQEDEARNKRRMGLGVTGLANAGEMLGYLYGTDKFLAWMEAVFKTVRDECYRTSANLAKEKGTFPLYTEQYLDSHFINTLSPDVIDLIKENGMRNSHLTSIAPTGTISLCADNVSSGIEPVFSHYYDRTIQTFEGPKVERVMDYAYSKGVEGRGANDISVQDHLKVLLLAQNYVDSACSKTCNVGDDVTYDEFKQVYVDAWKGNAKGCTTFRLSGKRFGILNETVEEETKISSETQTMVEETGKAEACFIDPLTGQKECA